MLNLSIKWIESSVGAEIAVKDISLLDLKDGIIVKRSEVHAVPLKRA